MRSPFHPDHHTKHIVGIWIAVVLTVGAGWLVWHSYIASNPFGG